MGSDKSRRELKQLGFVRTIALKVLLWISNLYVNAKKRSPGLLKSAVEVVEKAVNVVIAPVYQKFKGMSDHLLAFFDQKADGVVKRFDKYAPASIKQFVNKARSMAQNALEVAQKVVLKTLVSGPRAAICYLITLLGMSITRLFVRFWFEKLPFIGAIRGVFGTVGVLIPMKNVTSIVGDVVGAVKELLPVKDVASAVGHVAGVVGGLVPMKGVGGVTGVIGELKKNVSSVGDVAGVVGGLIPIKGVGGVTGVVKELKKDVGGVVGGVTSAVEEHMTVKGVADAVEGLLPKKSVTDAATAKLSPF